jgi:hypothetical protein
VWHELDPADVKDCIADLARQRTELHRAAGLPEPHGPGEMRIHLAVDASLPAPVELLRALHEAGVGSLDIVGSEVHTASTRTIGVVSERVWRGRPLRIADDGVDVTLFSTWAKLAAAADRGELTIRLPPDETSKDALSEP